VSTKEESGDVKKHFTLRLRGGKYLKLAIENGTSQRCAKAKLSSSLLCFHQIGASSASSPKGTLHSLSPFIRSSLVLSLQVKCECVHKQELIKCKRNG